MRSCKSIEFVALGLYEASQLCSAQGTEPQGEAHAVENRRQATILIAPHIREERLSRDAFPRPGLPAREGCGLHAESPKVSTGDGDHTEPLLTRN